MVSSCCSSSAWISQVVLLTKKEKCNTDYDPYCPLHEKIFDAEYKARLADYYDTGRLSYTHLINSYYTESPDDVNTGTIFLYYNDDFTKCTVTNVDDPKNMIDMSTESIIYKSSYLNKKKQTEIYFYTSMDLITDISSELSVNRFKYKSLDQFLSVVKGYDNRFTNSKYRNIPNNKDADREPYKLECLFIEAPFTGMVGALGQSIYKFMDAKIVNEYYGILSKKVIAKERMTMFEFFSYFAIMSVANRKTYSFLKSTRKITPPK